MLNVYDCQAYLNITDYMESTTQSPSEVVQEIRDRIFQETGLTASAGKPSSGLHDWRSPILLYAIFRYRSQQDARQNLY
jgi:hypothetical protein